MHIKLYFLTSYFYNVWHLHVANLLHGLILGCIAWTRKTNTAAMNGVLYTWTTETTCMTACLSSPFCAAIDIGPAGCVLHNVSDLSTTYYAPGVTQFILNRNCLSPSPLTTGRPFTSTASEAITTGMSWKLISFIVSCKCTDRNWFWKTNIMARKRILRRCYAHLSHILY